MSDTIKLSSPATREFWELPVLFEDDHLLAIDKPSRLLVSPDRYDPQRPNLMKLLHAADFDAGTGSPHITFHMLNNLTITGNVGPVINVFSSSTGTGGLLQGRIDGNHVGTAGSNNSGSTGV